MPIGFAFAVVVSERTQSRAQGAITRCFWKIMRHQKGIIRLRHDDPLIVFGVEAGSIGSGLFGVFLNGATFTRGALLAFAAAVTTDAVCQIDDVDEFISLAAQFVGHHRRL